MPNTTYEFVDARTHAHTYTCEHEKIVHKHNVNITQIGFHDLNYSLDDENAVKRHVSCSFIYLLT